VIIIAINELRPIIDIETSCSIVEVIGTYSRRELVGKE
jgi:hypothetical protein